MSNDSVSIIRAALEAYVKKDRAALEKVIAPDFHFSSPLDNRLDRATYFEVCWPNSRRCAKFEIIDSAVVRDRVYVTYVGETVDGRRFQNTELHTLRGGQVVEVEVYFGWTVPHPVPAGTHQDSPAASTQHP